MDVLASTLQGWSHHELVISMLPGNGVPAINDLSSSREMDRLGFDNSNNFVAQKIKGHLGRMVAWLESAEQFPEDDEQVGRLLFGSMKRVAGNFKNVSQVLAKNEEHSIELITKKDNVDWFNPLAEQAVVDTINSRDDRSLGAHLAYTISGDIDTFERLYPFSSLYYGRNNSLPIKRFIRSMQEWMVFSTRVVLWAQERRDGDLTKVPMLEPKSISAVPEPKIIYPFVEGFWQTYSPKLSLPDPSL